MAAWLYDFSLITVVYTAGIFNTITAMGRLCHPRNRGLTQNDLALNNEGLTHDQ